MFRLFNFATYLPIIDIPLYRGGPCAVRGASYKGLTFLCGFLIAVGLLAFYKLKAWYLAHPVLGKIALVVLIWWTLRQVVHFFRELNDDPLTRTEPRKWD